MTPLQIAAENRRQANSQRERPVLVSPFPLCLPLDGGIEIPAGVYFDVPQADARILVADGFAKYVDDVPAGWDGGLAELRPFGGLPGARLDEPADVNPRKSIDPLGLIFFALFVLTLVLAAAKGVGVIACSWWFALAPLGFALALFVGLLAAIFVGGWREEGD